MAYDERLAERIRELIGGLVDTRPAVVEKKMFGGLGFLVGGNMAVAASSQGGIMVRVDPAVSEDLVASTAAYPMVMRDRPMAGWLLVDAAAVDSDEQLGAWVRRGVSYAETLPPKAP